MEGILSSNNPFYECYTTNENDKRACYGYDYSNGSWSYYHTEKKDWLKRGILNRFVAVSSGVDDDQCGMDQSSASRTTGVAVSQSLTQTILSITPMEGKHQRETTTIEIGEKNISVVGRGKTVSVIGTNFLSSTSTTLFSVSTGHLGMSRLKVDCNSIAKTSPIAFVVPDGSGPVSLEDVFISGVTGGSIISPSVFEVQLRQLTLSDIEIENMKMSQPLFVEPSSAGST
ncbi:uncharacterized protein MONOS_15438 [Monocercomonoides exilis]|uniref:uncharacterized protein n=1 Tax=Monocercomonoides exilis TaxID=2049356 RepID=UPI00355A841B|nr:hypothetical protein MONOS_15438 [Monocercomonoides exilis]|eukprot:MONOS_15438.1-p1 / transcript=MONOS_15438.1 / gene=MONOS_15438 / organism=Monocercomonoides_exilis_PA203 / gene_product=unspecified product / transcript_product=unspecified product / location=Mono_scaffold01232:6945-7770(-) / protein_length=229 / sequence_SO=supercontig / SO=protein_coding / is_pseudo=false